MGSVKPGLKKKILLHWRVLLGQNHESLEKIETWKWSISVLFLLSCSFCLDFIPPIIRCGCVGSILEFVLLRKGATERIFSVLHIHSSWNVFYIYEMVWICEVVLGWHQWKRCADTQSWCADIGRLCTSVATLHCLWGATHIAAAKAFCCRVQWGSGWWPLATSYTLIYTYYVFKLASIAHIGCSMRIIRDSKLKCWTSSVYTSCK